MEPNSEDRVIRNAVYEARQGATLVGLAGYRAEEHGKSGFGNEALDVVAGVIGLRRLGEIERVVLMREVVEDSLGEGEVYGLLEEVGQMSSTAYPDIVRDEAVRVGDLVREYTLSKLGSMLGIQGAAIKGYGASEKEKKAKEAGYPFPAPPPPY